MGKARTIVTACGLLILAVVVVPTASGEPPPDEGTTSPSTTEPVSSTGVAAGVDSLQVPDAAAVQRLLGASDRVESGNANAYVATYSPEFNTGYFAVTTDQGISSSEVRARFAQLTDSGGSASAAAGLQTVIVFSKYSSRQIQESLDRLTASAESTTGGTAFYYDPATDSILLTAPDGFSVPDTAVPVTSEAGEVGNAWYRENMTAPFRGGGTIYNSSNTRCTSGIPAYTKSGTLAGYFTAGHCFALSAEVYSSTTHTSTYDTGKVNHRYSLSAVDAEFISTKTYSGAVYTSTLSTIKPIIGTYFPAAGVGNRLCFSGSTTNVQCGNELITYSGNFCAPVDPGGSDVCNNDMIALRGGVATQPGDSGGPVYANFGDDVKVSGIIRGYKNPGIGSSTSFAVDWRKIASTYGATLM